MLIVHALTRMVLYVQGATSRNLIVVSPRRFDLVDAAAAATTAESKKKGASKWDGLFGGGRWALSWFTAQGATTAGAYHLLTIVHVFKPHVSSASFTSLLLSPPLK